ncbi:MAG TPA: DUF4870 domain-containing protein [Terriglobales bacterium]|nr:DUF4870 domain-containing protein [Terriglobales bacterium]
MAFCSGCGASIPEGATFCATCGRSTAGPGGTAAAPAPAASAGGLTDNLAGALAYIPIAAIIFLVLEPYNRNKFIRFHSFQSLAFCVAWFVICVGLSTVPFLGFLRFMILPIIWLGFFLAWIVLMIKAYQGQMFKAPVIGDFAEKQA